MGVINKSKNILNLSQIYGFGHEVSTAVIYY